MNFVCFSPHFPPNYVPFATNLRRMGVTVLGLADAYYDDLPFDLRGALSEYYRVDNMHHYDDLVRALGYYTHRYGKIDRFESHNEYWLESDARLRTDFNIPGFKSADLARIKRKSEMKKVYQQCGIPVARGRVISTLADAQTFVEEVGFPIIAKPDIGVGATHTHKIHGRAELEDFFNHQPLVDYIFEEFIEGEILTFDGLTDQDANIVFYSGMSYSGGVMESVNHNLDFVYYTLRDIAPDMVKAGKKLVKAHNVRERFFHFEFFRTPGDQLIGLEVNMRPPGGLTTDMWNYANDLDIYHEYANVVVNNRFDAHADRSYFCVYIGRRNTAHYLHSISDILANFPNNIVYHQPISGIFAAAIGDYGLLLRSPELEEITEMVGWILEKEE